MNREDQSKLINYLASSEDCLKDIEILVAVNPQAVDQLCEKYNRLLDTRHCQINEFRKGFGLEVKDILNENSGYNSDDDLISLELENDIVMQNSNQHVHNSHFFNKSMISGSNFYQDKQHFNVSTPLPSRTTSFSSVTSISRNTSFSSVSTNTSIGLLSLENLVIRSPCSGRTTPRDRGSPTAIVRSSTETIQRPFTILSGEPPKFRLPSTKSKSATERCFSLCIADQPLRRGYLTKMPWLKRFELSRHMEPSGSLKWDDIDIPILIKLSEPNVNGRDISKWIAGPKNLRNLKRIPDSTWREIMTIEGSSRCILYRGDLVYEAGDLSDDNDTPSWSVRLLPQTCGLSNRFYRKFGSDRFLRLRIPQRVCNKVKQGRVLDQLYELLLQPVRFLDRTYECLYTKDDYYILFATEGENLLPLSVKDVLEWHIPLTVHSGNLIMTMSKFWSRITLGFSSTEASLTFDAQEVEVGCSDVLPSSNLASGRIMSDGCGPASIAIFRELSVLLGQNRIACAVQARLGGAKGVWMIDPNMNEVEKRIQIRESQLKYKLDPSSYDLHQWTLDICKTVGGFSYVKTTGSLNPQVMGVMQDCGVPTSSFIEILNEYLDEGIENLMEWSSTTVLISSLSRLIRSSTLNQTQPNEQVEDDTALIDNGTFKSGLPRDVFALAFRMVSAGFMPPNTPYLAHALKLCMEKILDPAKNRYKIPVKASAQLLAIPDPTGLLEPGEVFIRLSSSWINPQTGMEMVTPLVGKVVVTRTPCLLPTDVQVVTARDHLALHIFIDVIVFSVKGEMSVMELLSGGDFDGDTVYIYWDPRIVGSFKPANLKYANAPFKEEEIFEKDLTTVQEYLGNFNDRSEAFKTYGIRELSHGSKGKYLGLYHGFHVINSYYFGHRHDDSIYLAHMCAKLVDAPKQGLNLKDSIFQRDKAKFGFAKPKWYEDVQDIRYKRGRYISSYENIPDAKSANGYLISPARWTKESYVIDALQEEISRRNEKIMREFSTKLRAECVMKLDEDLAADWTTAKKFSGDAYKRDLERVSTFVDHIHTEYKALGQETREERQSPRKKQRKDNTDSSSPIDDVSSSSYGARVELLIEEYKAWPSEDVEFESSEFRLLAALLGRFPIEFLKASYAYHKTYDKSLSKECYVERSTANRQQFCWRMAYDTLCLMKASRVDERKCKKAPHVMIDEVYQGMRIDPRWSKRILESNIPFW